MALEDCTTDVADMGSMQKLPNQIQLVESDLPLAEAENVHYLLGNYLFRWHPRRIISVPIVEQRVFVTFIRFKLMSTIVQPSCQVDWFYLCV